MRIRIGSYNDKYWVEGRFFLCWHRLPSLSHFIKWDGRDEKAYRYRESDILYFTDYEKARLLADEYIGRFNESAAVYTEIKA
jgi:hypothetical protein